MNATKLIPGAKATITQIAESTVSIKLLEMGCVPGTPIYIEFKAPGGDPIAFNIDGYLLGLRISEAVNIEVELIVEI